MLKTLLDLFGVEGKAVDFTPSEEPATVTGPVRIPFRDRAIDLTVGKQSLRLYPEVPIAPNAGAVASVGAKDWILVDPERFFSGIAGFSRLGLGQTVLVGRDNDDLVRIFDFPKSVKRRHLTLANEYGNIVIRPLDSEGTTSVAAVAEDEDADWFAARRVENLRRLRKILGGPIEMLEPDDAMAVLERFRDILKDEAYRPRDKQNRPGGLLELPADRTPIIVGDIHAQFDNLLNILSLDGYLDALEQDKAYLLFLGDIVHREGDGELEEMGSSLLTLDLLYKLKTEFPKNIFFLRGNHESFEDEVGKSGVPQGRLLWKHARNLRGKKYAKLLEECFGSLAYMAKTEDFVACHAGPPRQKVSREKLIGINDHPVLANQLIWSRMRRTGRPGGYAKSDVKTLRASLGTKKDTPFLVSHTPLSRNDTVWMDAGEIPGHNIIFSANPEKLAVFVRSGKEMIPLELPGEALLDFANSLSAA